MSNFNLIISIYFILAIVNVSSNTLLHRYPRQLTSTKKSYVTTNEENSNNFDFAISVNEARLVACGYSELCQKVEEFKITENSSYNCFDKYLPIVFNILAVNKSKLPTKGFLEQHTGHIHLQQSNENVCRKIKRFHINEKITLFTIDESIHITERTKVNKMIEKELYLSFEFWILLLFKLGIYDEQNDDIFYFKAIKEFSFYFMCTKFLYLFVAYAFCFYKCFKLVMEENTSKNYTDKKNYWKKSK